MMPTRQSTLELIDIEIAIKEAEERAALEPAHDWFGPDCGCPAEKRKDDGSCRDHPRARDKQRPPVGDWETWLILAGRGFGKSRVGAEWVRHMAAHGPKNGRWALVGQQASDVRDIMIEGESGILAVSPPWFRPIYEPTKRKLTWPNGAIGLCYSAEEPGQFRGPQFHGAWCDELSKWKNVDQCWDNLSYGTRLGRSVNWIPRTVITTTPLPIRLIKEITREAKEEERLPAENRKIVVTIGSMYENAANLAESFVAKVRRKYEGTRLGRQEIHAAILDDAPGAFWKTDQIDGLHIAPSDLPELERIIVAVDPSARNPHDREDDDGDEAGIVVVGMAYAEHPTLGYVGFAYVLEDASMTGAPLEWGRRAVKAYEHWQADLIVAETNMGGDMVRTVLHSIDPNVPFKKLWASRGKALRAEPVSALYDQDRVFHAGEFPELEAEMCSWEPGPRSRSPNRLDAMVFGVTEAVLEGAPASFGPAPFANYRGMDA